MFINFYEVKSSIGTFSKYFLILYILNGRIIFLFASNKYLLNFLLSIFRV